MKIFSIDQIQQWDDYTINHEPIDSVELMERASYACFKWLNAKFTSSQENLEKVALLATKRLKESSLSEELKNKLLPRFSVERVKSLDFINDTLVGRGLEPITFMEINGAKVIDGKLVNC